VAGRARDTGRELPSSALDGRGVPGPSSPGLVVVARGQPRLLRDLRAIFRDEIGIRVIENRRRDRALLPRRPNPDRVIAAI
jgi:hypothetical protein